MTFTAGPSEATLSSNRKQAGIAVIVPCHNNSPHLAEALQSILAQTLRPAEIVVVDDASTDESACIARSFPVQVVQLTQNVGASAARNIGVANTASPLLAFLDADDLWAPSHLAELADLLERFSEAAVAHGRTGIFGDFTGTTPSYYSPNQPQTVLELLLRDCILQVISAVVRRSAFELAGGFDEQLRAAEDYDLWLRLSAAHKFICSSAVTSFYRQHPSQSSRQAFVQLEPSYLARYNLWKHERHEWMARALLEEWEARLELAWRDRDRSHFRRALALAPLVPGSEATRAHWARMAYFEMPWSLLLHIWDTVPEGLRETVRTLQQQVVERK